MKISKEKAAKILVSLLPIAYLAPPVIRIFGIQVSWYELVFLLALVLAGWMRTRRLTFLILVLGLMVFWSNLSGMANLGYGFNPHNFKFIKYIPMYLGAIGLGLFLPENLKLTRTIATFCLVFLCLIVLGADLNPYFVLI